MPTLTLTSAVQEPVERLSLAPDGAFLASAGHDSRVHIWDTSMLIGDGGDDDDEEEGEEEAADEVRRKRDDRRLPSSRTVCSGEHMLCGFARAR